MKRASGLVSFTGAVSEATAEQISGTKAQVVAAPTELKWVWRECSELI